MRLTSFPRADALRARGNPAPGKECVATCWYETYLPMRKPSLYGSIFGFDMASGRLLSATFGGHHGANVANLQ